MFDLFTNVRPLLMVAMLLHALSRPTPAEESQAAAANINALSAAEKEQGFALIFDGMSFTGWEQKGNWEIVDGAFARVRGGGDLTYKAQTIPDDFEVRFEWKVSKGCNSGVYYRPGQVEYQILDNVNSPYGENPRQAAASLFFCMAPSKDVTRPLGEWQSGRIVCQGTVIQHWLNDELVLDFDYTDPQWFNEVDLLRIRGGDLTGRGGHLLLQDHGADVWFRKLRLREIPAEEKILPSADFEPMPVPPAALAKERVRLDGMLQKARAQLIPADWNPVAAGNRVLQKLVQVTPPHVKGAHDADFVIHGERAYIVAEVNDVRPGESPAWPEVYVGMSIVNMKTLQVEQFLTVAQSDQEFDNAKLPRGACFVPRIVPKDDHTLRCFFATEHPGQGQSQVWYRDFDLTAGRFLSDVHKAKLKTSAGTFDMQPRYFYADAVAQGFQHPEKDYGVYPFDAFKKFDGKLFAALNNYPIGQNALALVHDDLATFEVLGHFFQPTNVKLTESAVNRLPDRSWLAICRQEAGDKNYLFTSSQDGKTWTPARPRYFVYNGAASKPTFDKFGEYYYLGWQDSTRIDGVNRSVFNLEISPDGRTWARKYRFETTKSFQYPTFREHDGTIWVAVTQGDSSHSRKERIMFGKLEVVGQFSAE